MSLPSASTSERSVAMDKHLHIAMFPWLAFGHIIPYLELSKFLVRKGHKISFISTPRNIDRLPNLSPEFSSSITFVKLPLPKIDGLPQNAEATMDVGNDEIPYLKKAVDGLEPSVALFLENSLPNWIIFDFAYYWLPPVAAKLGIKNAFYSIINAWFIGILGPSTDVMINGHDNRTKAEDFTSPPKWVPFETKVAYKLYESRWILGGLKENVSGISDVSRTGLTIKGTDAILIRHCKEFEGEWLKLLEDVHHKKVIPLGLMPPLVPVNNDSNQDSKNTDESWLSVKKWLDKQEAASVVYVALGSEVSLTEDQISELALGLELSEVPFFWALRITSNLPEGFEERVMGRGIVWKSWAPQLKILGHNSVGAFLTHCGWSSSIEGIMFGHPLIMLPFLVDQGLNSRVLEHREVGIEVPRNEENGSYTRNSVAESMRMVMVDENVRKKLKGKAKERSQIFGDKTLHDSYLEDFNKYLECQSY